MRVVQKNMMFVLEYAVLFMWYQIEIEEIENEAVVSFHSIQLKNV